ncbi:MAG: thioesterase family protein [Polyangiaceae bacterium]|nr:thioesterase family protein [Polyangiaceae bacterium]
MTATSPSMRELTSARSIEPGRFEIDIPDGWQQGKGAFGGLVVSILIRCSEVHMGDASRPLRSITAELCGPTEPGAATIMVETLRAGGMVTTVAARLVQAGQVQAHAVAVFGKARLDATWATSGTIAQPSWRDIQPLPMDGPGFPTFAKHYEFRNTGPLPFAGGKEALAHGWVRPRNVGGPCDAAWVAACADGWWPALFTVEQAPRPMATVAYTLDVVGSLEGLDPTAPLFHVGRVSAMNGGYFVETRELRSETGALVGINQQTFVVVR